MKKHILLFFTFSLLISSCKNKTVIENELDLLGVVSKNYNEIDTSYYENKKVKSLRFYIAKTEYIDVNFYESGKRKSIGNVKNNQCHNEYIDWYENGKQKWIRNYNLGNQIGKSKSYFENGNLEKEYDNDTKESINCWENGKAKFKFIENVSSSYHYFNGNYLEKYKNKLRSIEKFNFLTRFLPRCILSLLFSFGESFRAKRLEGGEKERMRVRGRRRGGWRLMRSI